MCLMARLSRTCALSTPALALALALVSRVSTVAATSQGRMSTCEEILLLAQPVSNLRGHCSHLRALHHCLCLAPAASASSAAPVQSHHNHDTPLHTSTGPPVGTSGYGMATTTTISFQGRMGLQSSTTPTLNQVLESNGTVHGRPKKLPFIILYRLSTAVQLCTTDSFSGW